MEGAEPTKGYVSGGRGKGAFSRRAGAVHNRCVATAYAQVRRGRNGSEQRILETMTGTKDGQAQQSLQEKHWDLQPVKELGHEKPRGSKARQRAPWSLAEKMRATRVSGEEPFKNEEK